MTTAEPPTAEEVKCPNCSAPGKVFKSGCGCIDYDCGTQVLCDGVFPEPKGTYRSKACQQIELQGGWRDERSAS